MLSATGTSPDCSGSPPVLTPATASSVNKPLAPMPGSKGVPPISINKTWILPPKPKPGRKPAVDTPPTKRKAQNREAQRAFRERRAAKVGELEEEMKKMEEEDAREQEALRDVIKHLERRVDDCGKMAEAWREKYNEMQMRCGRERQLREQVESELMILRNGTRGGIEAVPLPARTRRRNEQTAQQPSSFSDENRGGENNGLPDEVPMTCGKCTNDTRCQCIEEAFEMSNIADETSEQTFKRPHSPPSNIENKRICQNPNASEDTEIDFTAQFSTRRPPALASSASTTSSSIPAIAPPDPCGFCSDGTPCICAEMAKHQDIKVPPPKHQPSLSQQPQNNSIPTTTLNPCVNGPGTCAQCLSNPTSTLFCKTVAAANDRPSTSIAYPPPPLPPHPSAQSETAKLTCADAFTTLSRHPNFSAATNELNTWVPQLTAVPKAASSIEGKGEEGGGRVPQRTAFDIEAASVMAVLKFFDRRFGADAERQ